MAADSRYFELSLESLRVISAWAADCSERVLPLFEAEARSDCRPREAIAGAREFARGGKRAAKLRSLATAAHASARELRRPSAAAAARAAGFAAATAFTHPLADVHQTKHIIGAAGYAALALELSQAGDAEIGDSAVQWAVEHAPAAAGEVLLQMPARVIGSSRLDVLLYALDSSIRRLYVGRSP